jgi:hypothetical protein
MLKALADLFWNRKTGISHADFVRGLTILVVLAATGIVDAVGFQLLQVYEYQSLAKTDHIFKLQFYAFVASPFVPDLVAAPLLFGCLTLFLKRAAAIRLGTVWAALAGLLAFFFFRSFNAIATIVTYASQRDYLAAKIGGSLPVVAWVVGALAFAGFAVVIFFLVRRIPEDRRDRPASDSMTSQRLVRAFWLIFFSVLGIELALMVTFAVLANFDVLSRETFLSAAAIGTGVTSIVGQIVLAVAFGRRLKDAGFAAWIILVVLIALWAVEGLLFWGIFSQPPTLILQALNLALFFVVDLGPVGVILLILLPSKEGTAPVIADGQ